GMTNLSILYLDQNQLTDLTLPTNLTSLTFLQLEGNQISSLTLPPDVTNLTSLFLDGNPLTSLVLSEPAATNLPDTVDTLRIQKVSVFIYPLTVQMVAPRQIADGSFTFAIVGPPGVYELQSSTNLSDWSDLGLVTNTTDVVRFDDIQANLSPQKFY